VSSAPPRPGPDGLGIGDRVWFQARLHTVVGLSGTLVRLADAHGQVSALHLPQLQASPGFAIVAQRAAVRVPPAGRLERLPEAVVARAVWWEGHILEVLTGRVADAAPGTLPRPAYDPTVRSLAEREAAKAAELAAAGQARVSVGTVWRKRLRYQAKGLGGLVDGRGRSAPGCWRAGGWAGGGGAGAGDRRGHRCFLAHGGLVSLADRAVAPGAGDGPLGAAASASAGG
jgi:hypothetical protein